MLRVSARLQMHCNVLNKTPRTINKTCEEDTILFAQQNTCNIVLYKFAKDTKRIVEIMFYEFEHFGVFSSKFAKFRALFDILSCLQRANEDEYRLNK